MRVVIVAGNVFLYHYLEIGYTSSAGKLNPGASALVSTWFNKTNWSIFDQTNDYSFINSSSTIDSEKIPGYISGALAWGVEPVLLDMPAFPVNFKAVPADTSISLTWDPVPGVSGYELYADGTTVTVSSPSYLHSYLRP